MKVDASEVSGLSAEWESGEESLICCEGGCVCSQWSAEWESREESLICCEGGCV